MADAPWWVGAVGVIGGYGLKSAQDWFTHKWTAERDRAAREEERQAQLAEKRAAFQRETLLALQESLMRLQRVTAQAHFEDVMAHRGGKEWGKHHYSEQVDEGHRAAHVETAVLMVRVRDDQVRSLVLEIQQKSAAVVSTRGEEESDSVLTSMALTANAANDRIGVLLRQIDDAS